MAKFKIIVSDSETGKSESIQMEGPKAVPLVGSKLGDTVDGSIVGMSGVKLQITGGSDKDGFPMRPDVHGGVRIGIVITRSVGFKARKKGERQRRTLRGNVITEEIVQINMKTLKPKEEKANVKLAKKGRLRKKQDSNRLKNPIEKN
jgi:small subunit ribosomal protein S6e